MKPERISNLLKEAAIAPDKRRDAILAELVAASRGTIWEIGLLCVIWREVVANGHVGLLPVYYPLFALLCGERAPRKAFAQIDWTLFPMSRPMIKCPGCDAMLPNDDGLDQTVHMEQRHPGIVAERQAAI